MAVIALGRRAGRRLGGRVSTHADAPRTARAVKDAFEEQLSRPDTRRSATECSNPSVVLHETRGAREVKNVTITVDEEVLRRARVRALEQRTSVNRVLAEYLRSYAGVGAAQSAVGRALAIARRSNAGSGVAGRTWRREDLHER